jgi:nitrile hydratase accessory protein
VSTEFFAVDEAAAPPRLNGELVFAAPWESRVFGLAAALRDRGVFDWDEFRVALIAEIAHWESAHAPDDAYSYYACWQRALLRILTQKGVVAAAELDAREHALAARPAGHDHGHDHELDHDHDHDH